MIKIHLRASGDDGQMRIVATYEPEAFEMVIRYDPREKDKTKRWEVLSRSYGVLDIDTPLYTAESYSTAKEWATNLLFDVHKEITPL